VSPTRFLAAAFRDARIVAVCATLAGIMEASGSFPLVPAVSVRGSRGAVTSPHALASQAGLAILRFGGSAVDAAIATNAALAVVAPYACGLGGDAFWLIWPGQGPDDETHPGGERSSVPRLAALNGSGRSAARASLEAAREAGFEQLPLTGPWTVTVPGAVRSWGDAHARHGRLPWPRLLEPAIELTAGFPASPTWCSVIEGAAYTYGEQSDWAKVFRPLGRPWRADEHVQLPSLGRTLRRLAVEGPDDYYAGGLAAEIAAYLAEEGSLIAPDDLARHRSSWSEPIRTTYRGVEATSHPPNSCGAVALEMLNILESLPAPSPTSFGPRGVTDARWTHLAIEAARLALADRDAYLTDPDAMELGALERLLDRSRAVLLAGMLDPDHVLPIRSLDGPGGGGTAYLAAADAWGGAVSLIQSNYSGFGSGLVDPETGIAFHNRGSFFSLDARHPNRLAPGKRTMHTLTPGMLFRDGRPWILHGSMGGEIQPQVFAQFVSAVVDGAVTIATAVAAPRWSADVERHRGPLSVSRLERGIDPAVAESLAARGHRIEWGGHLDSAFGHEHAIAFHWTSADGAPPTGSSASYEATADPRSEGLPAAY